MIDWPIDPGFGCLGGEKGGGEGFGSWRFFYPFLFENGVRHRLGLGLGAWGLGALGFVLLALMLMAGFREQSGCAGLPVGSIHLRC